MVSAKPFEPYSVRSVINPYQEKIVLNMTFQTSLIDSVQHVRVIFTWDAPCLFKMLGNEKKRLHLRSIMLIALPVFSEFR